MERCVDVHAAQPLPARVGLLELLPDEETRVLDDDVEAAEPLDRALDRSGTARRGLEVLVARDRAAARGLDFRDDGVGEGRVATAAVGLDSGVVHDDPRAVRGEGAGVRRAEAPAGAGDERHAAVEPNHASTCSRSSISSPCS